MTLDEYIAINKKDLTGIDEFVKDVELVPVFVPTYKNRPKANVLGLVKDLNAILVIDEDDIESYKDVDAQKVIIPKSDIDKFVLERRIVEKRRWILEYAIKNGIKKFFTTDDDLAYCKMNPGESFKEQKGALLKKLSITTAFKIMQKIQEETNCAVCAIRDSEMLPLHWDYKNAYKPGIATQTYIVDVEQLVEKNINYRLEKHSAENIIFSLDCAREGLVCNIPTFIKAEFPCNNDKDTLLVHLPWIQLLMKVAGLFPEYARIRQLNGKIKIFFVPVASNKVDLELAEICKTMDEEKLSAYLNKSTTITVEDW